MSADTDRDHPLAGDHVEGERMACVGSHRREQEPVRPTVAFACEMNRIQLGEHRCRTSSEAVSAGTSEEVLFCQCLEERVGARLDRVRRGKHLNPAGGVVVLTLADWRGAGLTRPCVYVLEQFVMDGFERVERERRTGRLSSMSFARAATRSASARLSSAWSVMPSLLRSVPFGWR